MYSQLHRAEESQQVSPARVMVVIARQWDLEWFFRP